MPLPGTGRLNNATTQSHVQLKMERAMEDLALKAEHQREQKATIERASRDALAEKQHEDELEGIRRQRIERIRREKGEEEANKGKGHGEVGRVEQDEFLPAVLGSARVVAHFFHREFPRCEVMDARLRTLAPLHLETRFVRIDAEKAPFFVDKLQIRVLPTLVFFEDGKAIGRKVGYEGDLEIDQLRDLEKSMVKACIVRSIKLPSNEDDDGDDDDENDQDNDSKRKKTQKVPAPTIKSVRKGTTKMDDWE